LKRRFETFFRFWLGYEKRKRGKREMKEKEIKEENEKEGTIVK